MFHFEKEAWCSFLFGGRLHCMGIIRELSLTVTWLVDSYYIENLKEGLYISQVSHMMLLLKNLNDIGKTWKQTYLELRYFLLCTFCIWDLSGMA